MIKSNSKVTLHFTIRLADGSVADSTKVRGKPATVQFGDGTLSPVMEQQLYNLQAGDKKTLTLAPEDAAGASNPANVHVLARRQFPADMLLEEGLIVQFEQQGREIPGIIRRIDAEQITVDFNHPLAGQTLNVDVEIIAVEE